MEINEIIFFKLVSIQNKDFLGIFLKPSGMDSTGIFILSVICVVFIIFIVIFCIICLNSRKKNQEINYSEESEINEKKVEIIKPQGESVHKLNNKSIIINNDQSNTVLINSFYRINILKPDNEDVLNNIHHDLKKRLENDEKNLPIELSIVDKKEITFIEKNNEYKEEIYAVFSPIEGLKEELKNNDKDISSDGNNKIEFISFSIEQKIDKKESSDHSDIQLENELIPDSEINFKKVKQKSRHLSKDTSDSNSDLTKLESISKEFIPSIIIKESELSINIDTAIKKL